MSENEKQERDHILEGLKQHDREHLERLCADLMLNYVVQKRRPMVEQATILPVPTEISQLSFHELITWMQQNLSPAELNAFRVQDGQVTVRAEGKNVPISALSPEDLPTPAPAPSPAPAAATAPSTSPATSTPAPADSASTPAPSATSEPDSSSGPSSDRFSMLEID